MIKMSLLFASIAFASSKSAGWFLSSADNNFAPESLARRRIGLVCKVFIGWACEIIDERV